MPLNRRSFLAGALSLPVVLAACGDDGSDADADRADPTTSDAGEPSTTVADGSTSTAPTAASAGWYMPAEEDPHERTWMCWPSSEDVWGEDLPDVQDAIARVATAIAGFEPVTILARPDQVDIVHDAMAAADPDVEVEVVEAPVDDLWARDTLPCFLVGGPEDGAGLAAGRVRFNGWGDKQVHDGDATLAALVADHLDIELFDSGITGEGGGLEVDGAGTVLAAASSWVNENRNPGMDREQVAAGLLGLLGADRMIWVDGLAGADITDGHIDTLARFAGPEVIVVDEPAVDDPDDPWVAVAARTRELVGAARTEDGQPYRIVEVVQPTDFRGGGEDFLSTYMNFYVCNGAVIAPEFGDPDADKAAAKVLEGLFPDRVIVQLDIDALAAGGGGIHCATQQEPKV